MTPSDSGPEGAGLLNRTLIVLACKFGREMVTEGKPGNTMKDSVQQPDKMTDPKHYGMHRHFTEADSVLLPGGGMKKGLLYGKAADELPWKVIEKPVSIDDLHATIYRVRGIPAEYGYVVERRPFYCNDRRQGESDR